MAQKHTAVRQSGAHAARLHRTRLRAINVKVVGRVMGGGGLQDLLYDGVDLLEGHGQQR